MTMRNVATRCPRRREEGGKRREAGRKFAVPICVMSRPKCCGNYALLHAATLGLLHDLEEEEHSGIGDYGAPLGCMSGCHSFRVANCDVNGRGAS